MKALRGTGADFYNRLQPALKGTALAMEQEFRDCQDPYKEAMKKQSREFGDEIQLALEHIRPVSDPVRAAEAAASTWERFLDMEKPLKARGISLQDLLWHQAAMRILPAQHYGRPSPPTTYA
jgi:hypothetical protein